MGASRPLCCCFLGLDTFSPSQIFAQISPSYWSLLGTLKKIVPCPSFPLLILLSPPLLELNLHAGKNFVHSVQNCSPRWLCWYLPVILALGRLKQANDHEFEVSLSCVESSSSVWIIKGDPVLKLTNRTWEMTQLRVLSTFSEDPASVPSTYVVAHNCNSSSLGTDVPFWPPWVPSTYAVHTYMQVKYSYT